MSFFSTIICSLFLTLYFLDNIYAQTFKLCSYPADCYCPGCGLDVPTFCSTPEKRNAKSFYLTEN